MPKSKSRKKKKSGGRSFQNQKFSPFTYIKSKGRSLPVKEVYISEGWEELGALCVVTVVKEQPSGKYAMGLYMVDTGCLGLKNTDCVPNLSWSQIEENVERIYKPFEGKYETTDFDLANALIWGAIEYADEIGFKPQKDFKHSQFLLKDKKNVDDDYEMAFGDEDGKPLYIAGPYDDPYAIVQKLEAKLGEGNYNFVDMTGFSEQDVKELQETAENEKPSIMNFIKNKVGGGK